MERLESNGHRGVSNEQDDYFEPQNASSMINSIAKAQSKIQAQLQGNRVMPHFNRQNLSKSIILHHNKMSSLLSTVGRYNEGLGRPDIMEEDYEGRQHDDIDNIVVEDEGHMISMPGKLANGPIVQSVHANLRKDTKQPAAPFVDNYASQNSGQTYDTASFYHQQRGAVTNQVNSAQKDFSHMLNTTANKSSILGGPAVTDSDNMCSSSFEP